MRSAPGGGKGPPTPPGGVVSHREQRSIDPRPAGRRGAVLAVVVLAHVGLAGGLIEAMRRPAPGRAAQPASSASVAPRPAIVWWRPVPPPPRSVAAPKSATGATEARGPHAPAPKRATTTPMPTSAAAAAAAVQEPTPQPITLPATVAATPVPPSPPASRPLDLRLRPMPEAPSPAALARQDARLPRPPDADTRLARALGTDTRLTEQTMADGLRLRRGRDCVDLQPARATALDGFNAGARPVPRLASAC